MSKCVRCEQPFFVNYRENPETGDLPSTFIPNGTITVPGEIYSHMGKREVSITGLCEHCFDSIMYSEDDA